MDTPRMMDDNKQYLRCVSCRRFGITPAFRIVGDEADCVAFYISRFIGNRKKGVVFDKDALRARLQQHCPPHNAYCFTFTQGELQGKQALAAKTALYDMLKVYDVSDNNHFYTEVRISAYKEIESGYLLDLEQTSNIFTSLKPKDNPRNCGLLFDVHRGCTVVKTTDSQSIHKATSLLRCGDRCASGLKRTDAARANTERHETAVHDFVAGRPQSVFCLPEPDFMTRVESLVKRVGLADTLKPYQFVALAWMYGQERLGRCSDAVRGRLVNERGQTVGLTRHTYPDCEIDKQRSGGILAQEVGMGKTLEIIALIMCDMVDECVDDDRRDCPGVPLVHATLIVVPMTLITHWQVEIQKFAPRLRCVVYYGPGRHGILFTDCDIVLTTYETNMADERDVDAESTWKCPNVLHVEPHKVPKTMPSVGDMLNPRGTNVYNLGELREVVSLSPLVTMPPLQHDAPSCLNVGRAVRCNDEHLPFVSQCPKCGSRKTTTRHVSKSRLASVEWRRIVLDECHKLQPKTKVTRHTCELHAIRRWPVSATPAFPTALQFLCHNLFYFKDYSHVYLFMTLQHRKSTFLKDDESIKLLPFVKCAVAVASDATVRAECENHLALARSAETYAAKVQHFHAARRACTSKLAHADGEQRADETTQPSELHDCPVCLEPAVKPQSLPCGHVFCAPCLATLFLAEHLSCAVCRADVSQDVAKTLMKQTRMLGKRKRTTPRVTGVRVAQKVDALVKAVSERPGAYVTFTQFDATLDAVEHVAQQKGIPCLLLRGSMTRAARDRAIRAFNAVPPSTSVIFVLALRTAAIGLNLVRGQYVVFMEPCWNYALEKQAIGRVHRMGQSKQVEVVQLYCEATVEAAMVHLERSENDCASIVKALVG